MAMKRFSLLLMTFYMMTAVQADDVLDTKLAALKKRAQRNSYSSRAALQDQNLIVPKSLTEEEQELDAKLRAMEKQLDSNSGTALQRTAAPRPIRQIPQQAEESRNWLTPAMLNSAKDEDSPFSDEVPEWVTQELTRREDALREKDEKAQEQRLLNQSMQGTIQRDEATSYNPLPSYTESFRNFGNTQERKDEPSSPLDTFQTRSSSLQAQNEPSYMTEPKPISTFRTQPTVPSTTGSSLTQSRFSFPSQKEPSTIGNTATKKPQFKSSWDVINNEPEPVAPKKKRNSSLFETNPFDDDFMSRPKKSIWDD